MHCADIKAELQTRAESAGFMSARIASANLPAHYGQRLHQWTKAGMHGEMDYMPRTATLRAQGAEAILPGAKSIIVFAASYYPTPPPDHFEFPILNFELPVRARARIAKYALGEDYHLVFRQRLQPILDWLNTAIPNHSWRIVTDSAPLNERAYAIESGTGFMGRNTMVITPGAGSFFLLAGIVTTAELEPDPPISGTCGTCTRCIDSCPTNAIQLPDNGRPGLVDATRCISYLTIEKKSPLTDEEHAMSGNWAFGCDICQDVCPYNKTPEPVQMPELTEGTRLHQTESAETLLIPQSNRDFERRFHNSPLLRPGKRRLQLRAQNIRDAQANAEASTVCDT